MENKGLHAFVGCAVAFGNKKRLRDSGDLLNGLCAIKDGCQARCGEVVVFLRSLFDGCSVLDFSI